MCANVLIAKIGTVTLVGITARFDTKMAKEKTVTTTYGQSPA